MKSVFLLLSLCFLNVQAFGALNGTTLKGTVQTAEQQPAEFAVVTLLSANDSSLVKGAIVAADGSFAMEGIAPGKFLLTTMLTGYAKNWYGPFEVEAATPEINIPAITLSAAVNMNEVTVTAIQPLFVQKADMLIMNVENSPVRMSGTVFDLIQKVPGVTVNQNGVITMKGRSGVQVYVDGKPTYLAGDQLKQFLENMPAADVSRVEIITNPSSKYDAEGNSGILNIVTKKGTQQGLNGRVRVGTGYGRVLKETAGFSMNYGMPKANFYARYDFANWNSLDSTYIKRTVPYDNDVTLFEQNSAEKNKPFSHAITTGFDFKPNDANTFGIQLSTNHFFGTDITDNVTNISLENQDSAFVLKQLNNMYDRNFNLRGGLWYNHVFDTTGRELNVSADILGYRNYGHADFNSHFYGNSGNEIGLPFYQQNLAETDINIYVAQVDYTHPIGKKYKIETGLKSSFVETDNNLLFDIYDNGSWKNDTTRSNRFIYKEQINAAYAQGAADFGKTQIQVGLRVEQTTADGQSPTTGQNLKRTYTQLFPSLYFTHKFNDKNTVNFSYNRRINRPDYENLNPFLYYLDQFTYRVGNPYLQPEIAHTVEATHSFMDFIFTTVGASRTFDGIMDVTDQNDSTGATFQTTTNLNQVTNAWANLGFGVPIGKSWIIENNVSCVYLDYQSQLFGGVLNNQSVMWNFYQQHTISLPNEWKVQVSGFLQTGLLYGMFEVERQGYLDIGVSKSFFNKKLNASLNASDILYTSNTRVRVNYQNQNVFLINKQESRRVMLRVSYNFGNAKAARKTQYKSASEEIQKRAGKKD
ncbi:MAG: TonB-dependent receptor [Bacteroidetes bacterium]|nr:TonB-dependent receptor [Bacteroidota bacterium]